MQKKKLKSRQSAKQNKTNEKLTSSLLLLGINSSNVASIKQSLKNKNGKHLIGQYWPTAQFSNFVLNIERLLRKETRKS